MRIRASLRTVVIVLVVPVLVTACGDGGAQQPGGRQGQRDVERESAAPAVQPSGATARAVSYRCRSGREGTLVVDVPDLGILAARLDRVQPCEYDQGLSRATLTVTCRSGPLVVRLAARDGHPVQPSDAALCRT